MAAMLDLHKDASWYTPELSEIVNNSCDQNIGLLTALAQDIEAINNYQSLVNQQYGGGEANFEGILAMYPSIAEDLLRELDHAYGEELLMKERLQSFDNRLDEKIDYVDFWKNACAVFFTAAAATSAAAAAANANSNTAAAAAASAATILFGAAGKWMHSVMNKSESAVMKRKEIINVVISGAGSSINYLTNIHVLGEKLLCEAKAVMEMVDDGAVEVDVRKKVAELNNIFQELRGKANDYGPNMNRALEDGLQSIITGTRAA